MVFGFFKSKKARAIQEAGNKRDDVILSALKNDYWDSEHGKRVARLLDEKSIGKRPTTFVDHVGERTTLSDEAQHIEGLVDANRLWIQDATINSPSNTYLPRLIICALPLDEHNTGKVRERVLESARTELGDFILCVAEYGREHDITVGVGGNSGFITADCLIGNYSGTDRTGLTKYWDAAERKVTTHDLLPPAAFLEELCKQLIDTGREITFKSSKNGHSSSSEETWQLAGGKTIDPFAEDPKKKSAKVDYFEASRSKSGEQKTRTTQNKFKFYGDIGLHSVFKDHRSELKEAHNRLLVDPSPVHIALYKQAYQTYCSILERISQTNYERIRNFLLKGEGAPKIPGKEKPHENSIAIYVTDLQEIAGTREPFKMLTREDGIDYAIIVPDIARIAKG